MRAEAEMRVFCANNASAECFIRGRGIGQKPRRIYKQGGIFGQRALCRNIKQEVRLRTSFRIVKFMEIELLFESGSLLLNFQTLFLVRFDTWKLAKCVFCR